MNSIRNLAVDRPVPNGQLLAALGQDRVKGATYLRALGGGIVFGEFAVESKNVDAIALDAQLHVMDQGGPVGWFDLAFLDCPPCPEGSAALVRSRAGLGG